MVNISNLKECSIDSLKIRIPLDFLYSYDKTIQKNIISIDADTGELDREFKTTKKVYEFDSFQLTVNIFKIHSIDTLVLLVNSKQLGSRYFEGITNDTIRLIYDLCIDANIFNCPYATFLEARTSDTDYKKDFILPKDDYKTMIGGMYKMAIPSSNRDGGARKHKGNMGIEFSKRQTNSPIRYPFTKVYHKESELKTNSLTFSERYLHDVEVKDVIRLETTIKDSKHYQSIKGLNIKDNKLSTILNLTTEQKDLIMHNGFKKHLLPRKDLRTYKTDLSPLDLASIQMLNILTNEYNLTIENALERISENQKDKQGRYRLKKRLSNLYYGHIHNVDYREKNQNINHVLDGIGWRN